MQVVGIGSTSIRKCQPKGEVSEFDKGQIVGMVNVCQRRSDVGIVDNSIFLILGAE